MKRARRHATEDALALVALTLAALALGACASEPAIETPSSRADPPIAVDVDAAPVDPSQLAHVSVLATHVDSRAGVCVSSRAGRVQCTYAHEDWAWRDIPGLDGSRGVRVHMGGEICAVSDAGELECTTLPSPDTREHITSHVSRTFGHLGIRCALSPSRALTCWGSDDTLNYVLSLPPRWFFGGAPSDADGHVPPVVIARDVEDVAVTSHHVCILSGGLLTCAGANHYGQATDARPGADGARTVALDGVTAVSASGLVTCAIAHGEVWCWGEIGPVDSTRECIYDLASPLPGQRHAVPTRVVPASSGSPYVALAAGRALSCVMTADRELWCWAMRDPEGTFRRVGASIAEFDVAGTSYCFVDTDGVLVCDGETLAPPLSETGLAPSR